MNHVVQRTSFITSRLRSMILPVVDVEAVAVDVEAVEVKVEVALKVLEDVDVRVVAAVVVVAAAVEDPVQSASEQTRKDHVSLLHAWMMKMTFLALSILRHDCHQEPNLVGFCQENTERLYFKKQNKAEMLIENC